MTRRFFMTLLAGSIVSLRSASAWIHTDGYYWVEGIYRQAYTDTTTVTFSNLSL